MFKTLIEDTKTYYQNIKKQDFAFWMACAYLIFSYLRPQTIFPITDFLPWTQVSILLGLGYLAIHGRLQFQITHAFTLVFFLIVLNSAFNAYYPHISFKKIDVVFIWLLEMFFFTNCIRSIEQFKLITILFFLILFKISFFGARTWVQRGFGFRAWGIVGPQGFFANSGELSLLMAMLAIMSLCFLVGFRPLKTRLYYLLPLTAVMTVLAASSRGGQLALAIGLVLASILVFKLRIRNLLLVGVVAFVGISLLPEEQKQRFSTMGKDGTSESRLYYWEKGLEMLEFNKLTGVGYMNFPEYFHNNYQNRISSEYLANRREVAHNSLVETASELGYPGLICYAWFHFLCYFQHRKTRFFLKKLPEGKQHWIYKYSVGLDITIVVYFVGAFFMSVAYYPYIYFMMMFSQSLLNATKSEFGTRAKDSRPSNAKAEKPESDLDSPADYPPEN